MTPDDRAREMIRLIAALAIAQMKHGKESLQAGAALRDAARYAEMYGEEIWGDEMSRADLALRERGR